MNYRLSKEDRAERDAKIISLYNHGVTPRNLGIRFGLRQSGVLAVLKRNGIVKVWDIRRNRVKGQ